jgi:hypothetical protein
MARRRQRQQKAAEEKEKERIQANKTFKTMKIQKVVIELFYYRFSSFF